MSRVLLKYGGTRIGDQLHAIPLLKALKDNNIKVDLAHGWYEADVSKLLKHIGLVDRLYQNDWVDDPMNTDMNSIKKFIAHIGDMYNHVDNYIAILEPNNLDGNLTGTFSSTADIGIDLTTVPWAHGKIPDIIVGDYHNRDKDDNYIGVQPSSISTFKKYQPLYGIDYPGDVKSFGLNIDQPIDNAIQIHGKSMEEVYEELMTCCMVVSTHSSIGVLSYYLGIPQIFIHFWEDGLADLSSREYIIQPKAPTMSELQYEIDKLWNKLN